MWQKIVIAALVVTLIGAGVVAVLDAQGRAAATDEPAEQAIHLPTPTPQPAAMNGASQAQRGQGQHDAAGAPVEQQLNQAVATVGEPWSATGEIVEIGDAGLTLALADGAPIYVELGPSFYWQAQGALAPGETVAIDGFFNGEQYHAANVSKLDGVVLALRSATGQPLWSGGASGGAAGAEAGATQGGQGGAGQVQVAPEDWETLAATVVAVNRNGLTIETATGEVLALTFGNARFWQEQAVQFTAGDAVEVKGFWQDGQFQTGQVTNTTTGERLLLRDPNGRPLWGGPGRQGGRSAAPTNG